MSQVCEEYLRQVKKDLVGTTREKREFLAEMQEAVTDYTADHPNVSLDNLITHFGTPSDVAEEFAATSLNKKDIRAKSVTVKRLAVVVLAVVIITALVVVSIHTYNLWKSEQSRNGFFVENVDQDDVSIPLESFDEDDVINY